MASYLSNRSSKALFPHVTQNYSFAHKRRRTTPRRALTPRLVAAATAAKGGFYSEDIPLHLSFLQTDKPYHFSELDFVISKELKSYQKRALCSSEGFK